MRSKAGVLVVVGIIVLGLLAVWLQGTLRGTRAPRSVVLVTIDTLRADRVGAYGSTVGLTPEMDALAADGVVFENAWTTAPLTVPAHASMLTGLLPPLHGLRTNAPGRRLPVQRDRPYFTVAEVLAAAGLRTAAFVSASVLRGADTGLDAGFDVYDDVPAAPPGALHDSERRAGETVDAALAWVRGGEDRFFLWVHLFDPHAPYDAPSPWGAGPDHVADAAGYDGEVRYVDRELGRLRRGLADAGHGDAVLVVTSDHGEGLGEHGERTHGYLLHEATLHVPLIVAAPDLVAAGARRDDDVSVIDIAPTLVTLADETVPARMDGRALFAGGREGRPRAPYAESLYAWEGARWAQVFALRRGSRKIVDAGPRTMVFDLASDPTEERPVTLTALPAPDTPLADPEAHATVLDPLRRVAGLPPLAPPAAAPSSLSGGSYWSASTASEGILPREENAALPSPYDRMEVLARLDRVRSLLAAGEAEEAARLAEAIVEEDPGNPQGYRWLGRALLATGRPVAAAAAYRQAFTTGWTHSDCVAKALQASVIAAEAGERDEAARALEFLTRARGKGVTQDGPAFVFEALLLLAEGRPDDARRALDNARREPTTPWLEGAIPRVEERLP